MTGTSRLRTTSLATLCDRARRVAAVAIAMSLHVALLVLLVRPGHEWHTTRAQPGNSQAIQLRLFRLPRPAARTAASGPSATAQPSHIAAPSARHPIPAVKPAADTQPSPTGTLALTIPSSPQSDGATADGGFRQRLREARRAGAVHGMPGSDRPRVPGIRLTDPREQGLGSAMRKAQRLFGIANRHCIDVDVWRHLTPQELSARHISPADVDDADEKYQCNRPPGLSF